MAGILSRIEDLAGKDFFVLPMGSNSSYEGVLTRYVKSGVRDVVDRTLQVNPKDMHLFCQNILIKDMGTWGDNTNELTFGNHNIPWKDADGGYIIDNNYILWIARQYSGLKVPCQEVSAEKGLKVEDPESIFYTGDDYRNPVFYRSSSKVYIYPSITNTEKGWGSLVSYDEKFELLNSTKNAAGETVLSEAVIIDYFPNHLLFLVVLYAVRRGLQLVKGQNRKEYSDFYSTPIIVWKTLYGDSATLPQIPSFPNNMPEFGIPVATPAVYDEAGTLVTAEIPAATDTFPTIDFGGEADDAAAAFDLMWTRINDDEETDLVSSEMSRFNTMMSEWTAQVNTLNTRYGNVLSKYTTELAAFQQQYQTVMDAWGRYQQSYQTEQTLLDKDIARLTEEYMSYFLPKAHLEKTKEEGNY